MPHVNILADILDNNHKLLRLGNWLKFMTPSTTNRLFVGLCVLACVAFLSGCQSNSTQKDSTVSEAESAAKAAEILLASEQKFVEAMRDKDPLGMIDAAKSRDEVFYLAHFPDASRAIVTATTDRMIVLAMKLAADDEELLAKAELRRGLFSRNKGAGSGSVFGSGLDPSGSVLTGVRGLATKPSDFIKELVIDARSSVTLQVSIEENIGAIIYAEHPEAMPVVLTLTNGTGAVVCEDQNPRGFLICRWKAARETELTVTLNNKASRATNVLLIKNQ